jgi:Transposase, Mutator family
MSDGNLGLGAALDRLWPGVAHQRCTVHKLRNLVAKAPKHAHEAVREDYHRIVYAETRDAAQQARAAFLLKWKRLCPPVAAKFGRGGRATVDVLPVPGESAPVATHDEHHREDAARFPSPSQNPGGTAQRRHRATGVFRVVGQRTNEATPHQRLSRPRRERRSSCLIERISRLLRQNALSTFPQNSGHYDGLPNLTIVINFRRIRLPVFCGSDDRSHRFRNGDHHQPGVPISFIGIRTGRSSPGRQIASQAYGRAFCVNLPRNN